jgi:hypothetical protein
MNLLHERFSCYCGIHSKILKYAARVKEKSKKSALCGLIRGYGNPAY